MIRRFPIPALTNVILSGVLAGLLAGCGGEDRPGAPDEIVFSILSAENQASSGPMWEPLLADMEREIGVEVRPFFGSNYNALIEGMRFDQIQVGWFSALPALQAVERSNGEVVARTIDAAGADSYVSTLIVQAGSDLTLDRVMACDRTLDFGIGDAQSTSGTLAPMTFLFGPRGVDPTDCFRTVRAANHQANAFSVANGVVDVATSNSVNAVFLARQNPEMAARVREIWRSPPIPESGIVVRADLDPALKERIRSFFLTYGRGEGPEAERQRSVLRGLNYSAFAPAEATYLDPIREMRADQALRQARAERDTAGVARAEGELETLRARREVQP